MSTTQLEFTSRWHRCRVQAVHDVAVDIKSFALQSANGEPLPAWDPGAHIEVRVPSQGVRHYSLCGRPSDTDRYVIAVLRESPITARGGSEFLHTQVRVGDYLEIGAPRNHFPLVDRDAEYVLVAGGIGITPLLPMVRELNARQRNWRLVYGGRSMESMAFLQNLGEFPSDRVTFVDESEKGRIDVASIISAVRPGALVYCCGPTGLIKAVQTECAAREDVELRTETFGWPQAGQDHLPEDEHTDVQNDAPFTVELKRTGTCFTIEPGESVLDRVLEAVPDYTYSCEEGYCGSCETRVLEGVPVHRDTVLTPEMRESGKTMMICVSGCASQRLVLDI